MKCGVTSFARNFHVFTTYKNVCIQTERKKRKKRNEINNEKIEMS